MIFFKTWMLIFRGKKDQTRRPVFPDDESIYENDRIIGFKRKGRMYLRVGDGTVNWPGKQPTYAIQACRGGWQLGRFKILELRQERIRRITAADAIAEGIEHEDVKDLAQPLLDHFIVARFRSLWNSIYHSGEYAWENNPLVWVIKFEVVERPMVHASRARLNETKFGED